MSVGVTLKDFQQGESAYALMWRTITSVHVSDAETHTIIEKFTVYSVGQKYVTAGRGRKYKFQENKGDPWSLIHAEDELIYLFPSKEAVKDYEEMNRRRVEIFKAFCGGHHSEALMRLSLNQLKEIQAMYVCDAMETTAISERSDCE